MKPLSNFNLYTELACDSDGINEHQYVFEKLTRKLRNTFDISVFDNEYKKFSQLWHELMFESIEDYEMIKKKDFSIYRDENNKLIYPWLGVFEKPNQ